MKSKDLTLPDSPLLICSSLLLLTVGLSLSYCKLPFPHGRRYEKVFDFSASVMFEEGLWLTLLGPMTLASDEGHLTALG